MKVTVMKFQLQAQGSQKQLNANRAHDGLQPVRLTILIVKSVDHNVTPHQLLQHNATKSASTVKNHQHSSAHL